MSLNVTIKHAKSDIPRALAIRIHAAENNALCSTPGKKATHCFHPRQDDYRKDESCSKIDFFFKFQIAATTFYTTLILCLLNQLSICPLL